MKISFSMLLPLGLAILLPCYGGTAGSTHSLRFAEDAIAADPTVAREAIAHLRSLGPPGLKLLFDTHEEALAKLGAGPGDEIAHRLRIAVDRVSGQRDGHASQLYWFTDFDLAKEAAQASGRPILSLRLLGNLDEEFSCANSRFFRATLYANTEIAAYLRQHFVLHWKSVRPVPRLTIDFGDGRVVQRTITGNSIHYVLAADGAVVDALPGLYGPRAFLHHLQTAQLAAQEVSTLEASRRHEFLRRFHARRQEEIEQQWATDLRAINAAPELLSLVARPALAKPAPSALEAAPRAVSKLAGEAPILRASMPRSDAGAADVAFDRLQKTITDAQWTAIAALHADLAKLDAGARQLIRTRFASATEAGRVSPTKRVVEDPLVRTLRNLERSIAEDTVRNEYLFHSRIHEWLARETPPAVDVLNSRVYAELFLTPESDPWLGLLPADTFSALENDGRITQSSKR